VHRHLLRIALVKAGQIEVDGGLGACRERLAADD
jgi:hypothetical protein